MTDRLDITRDRGSDTHRAWQSLHHAIRSLVYKSMGPFDEDVAAIVDAVKILDECLNLVYADWLQREAWLKGEANL